MPPELVVELVDDEHAVFSWRVGPTVETRALTSAEADVLSHILAGASNHQIARARATSVRTVANQVAGLLRKLGVASRYDLIRQLGAHREAGRRS